MKRNFVLLTLGTLLSALAAGAQVFQLSSQGSLTLRQEGEAERVATVELVATAGGTIPAGNSIELVFGASIGNATAINAADSTSNTYVVCTIASLGLTNAPCGAANTTIMASANVLTITFTAATVITENDSILVKNVRVNATTLAPSATVQVNANTLPAAPPTYIGNPQTVGTVAATKALVVGLSPTPGFNSPLPGPFSILACSPPVVPPPAAFATVAPPAVLSSGGDPGPISFFLNAAKQYNSALSTMAEEAGAPVDPSVLNGSWIQIVIGNVPPSTTVTPVGYIACPNTPTTTCLLALSPLVDGAPVAFGGPAAQTTGASQGSLTFTFEVTATNQAALEDIDIYFNVEFTGTGKLPTGEATPGLATFSLVPTNSASIPYFNGAAEPYNTLGGNVITISDCGPVVSLSTLSAFPSEMVGTTSAPQAVTLSNTGDGPLTITSIQINGDFGSPSNTCGSSVAAGSSCTINVTFTPTATGTRTANLFVVDNTGNSPQSVSLSGTGILATTTTTVSSFVNPSVFGQSVTFTATVTPSGKVTPTGTVTFNDGTTTLGTGMLNGSAQATFSASALAVGAHSITVVYSANPNFSGSTSAALTQTVNRANTTTTITATPNPSMTGQGVTVSFTVAASPPASGTPTGSVSVNDGVGDSCNGTLAVGVGSCLLTPLTAGTLTLTATYSGDNHFNTSTSAGVSQTVRELVGGVSLSPSSLSFNPQAVGTTSTSQTVTFSSTGTAALTISNITTSAGFGIQSNTCPGSLPKSQTCTINVTFSPTSALTYSGQLTVTDNAPGSPQTVSLSGTGTGAVVRLSVPNLTFPAEVIGIGSAPQTVTLTDTGTASLGSISLTIVGTNSGDFSIQSTSTACGTSLASGSSCGITVIFTPTAAGSRTATLSIADNAAGSPQTVSLSGTGEDFSFGAAPPAQTVAAGQTATFQLEVSALGGFNQAVALSCAWPNNQPPPGAGCAVSPASVTPSAGGSPVMVTVTTAARSLAPPVGYLQGPLWSPPSHPLPLRPIAWVPLVLVLLALLGRRIQTPKWPTGVVLSGTLLLAVLWVACGGGGSTPPPPAPSVSLSPSTLTFSSQNADTTSAAQTVTLTNTGNAALTITSIAASSDFAETNTCGGSVAAAANCAMSVTFTPTKGGALAGQITITDNAAGSPQAVSLSGMGVGTTAGTYPLTVTATSGKLSHQTVLDLTVQ